MSDQGPIEGYTWRELVERAMPPANKKARGRWQPSVYWGKVADLFLMGSTRSIELCRAMGRDPDTGAKVEQEAQRRDASATVKGPPSREASAGDLRSEVTG